MSADLLDRFDPYTDEGNYYGYGKMLPEPEGDWVRYADHANALSRLTAELEAVKRERDALLSELKRLYSGYVNTLESGRDRIMWLGGTCDAVDIMEQGDPVLRSARELIGHFRRAREAGGGDG
jgi:hypothetical protein